MKIPDTLKIGAITYKIVLTDPSNLEGEKCGDWDPQDSTIRINMYMPEDQKWATLLHEAIHAMNCKIMETEVEFLAQSLLQILVDNEILKIKP